MNSATLITTLTASTALCAASANASLINVTSNYVSAGSNSLPLVGPLEGPAGGGTWNLLTSRTGDDLDTSSGTPTDVDFSLSSGDARSASTDYDLEVLRSYWSIFGKGSDVTLSFGGLTPGEAYDVWILSYSPSRNFTPGGGANAGIEQGEGAAGTWSTSNTTSTVGGQVIDNRYTAYTTEWVEGGNYVFFDNVIADVSGSISFLGDAADSDEAAFNFTAHRLPVSGAQIQLVPEPGSLALLSLGGLLVARRRRA